MNRSKTVTTRPWWSATRRGSANALRVVLALLIVGGMIYKATIRKARQVDVAAKGGVMVDANDRELRAIREEAQAHFPEFEAAFRNRDQSRTGEDAQVFAVLTDFRQKGSPDSEVMWVEVTSIMDASIAGTLADEPMGDIGYHAGDTVTVNPKRIRDWYYTDAQGGPHGGKSDEVFSRRK